MERVPLLARDLNEAWLGAGSYGAGKSNASTICSFNDFAF
jgi:hypothetical protein